MRYNNYAFEKYQN
jgi:hypothetical protein